MLISPNVSENNKNIYLIRKSNHTAFSLFYKKPVLSFVCGIQIYINYTFLSNFSKLLCVINLFPTSFKNSKETKIYALIYTKKNLAIPNNPIQCTIELAKIKNPRSLYTLSIIHTDTESQWDQYDTFKHASTTLYYMIYMHTLWLVCFSFYECKFTENLSNRVTVALLSQRTGSISNVAENLGGNSFSWISFTIRRGGSAATTRTFTMPGLCNLLRESHRDLFSDNPESTYQTSDVCLGLWPRFDDEVSRTIYIFPTDPLPRYRIYCLVFFPISTDIYH